MPLNYNNKRPTSSQSFCSIALVEVVSTLTFFATLFSNDKDVTALVDWNPFLSFVFFAPLVSSPRPTKIEYLQVNVLIYIFFTCTTLSINRHFTRFYPNVLLWLVLLSIVGYLIWTFYLEGKEYIFNQEKKRGLGKGNQGFSALGVFTVVLISVFEVVEVVYDGGILIFLFILMIAVDIASCCWIFRRWNLVIHYILPLISYLLTPNLFHVVLGVMLGGVVSASEIKEAPQVELEV